MICYRRKFDGFIMERPFYDFDEFYDSVILNSFHDLALIYEFRSFMILFSIDERRSFL